ncbi:MAG: 30S ribosomal protein S2 [Candidatus Omnitrophota bacterium]
MALPDIIKELLENGVHFGHLSKHWNPRMKRFIFGKKKNVYIIDLEKTAQMLQEAKDFASQVARRGGKVLFVGTKKQVRDTIKDLAVSCDMPYVVERWIGGFLTNFSTVKGRMKYYTGLLERRSSGGLEKLSNKEIVMINREISRMAKNYSGVISLNDLPECIYVIDPKKESACIREANKISIPVIALIDTDADPDVITHPVPGNDDAIKSVRYITSCIVDAIKEGKTSAENLSEDSKEQIKVNSEGAQVQAAESAEVDNELSGDSDGRGQTGRKSKKEA